MREWVSEGVGEGGGWLGGCLTAVMAAEVFCGVPAIHGRHGSVCANPSPEVHSSVPTKGTQPSLSPL